MDWEATNDKTCMSHKCLGKTDATDASPEMAEPRLGAAALEEYTPGLPVVRYRVVFQPRIAVRTSPNANGIIDRAIEHGHVLHAVELSSDRNWVRIGPKEWVMLNHPEHGPLLERLARDGEADDDEDEPW